MNTICEIKNKLIDEPKKDIEKVYYVYHLINPKDNLPFYVGKGCGWRIYRHESNVINGKLPNGGNKILYNVIKDIIDSNQRVIHKKIYDNLFNNESKLLEIEEIKKLKQIGIKLCNISKGGDDRPSRVDIGKHHSLIMMGHKVSDETKKKMSNAFWRNRSKKYIEYLKNKAYKCNFNKYWVGKNRSEESKQKYSISKLGNKNPMFKIISDNILEFIINLYLNKMSIRNIKYEVEKEFNFILSPNKISKELNDTGLYVKRKY